jgi:hypothetical protein
MSYNLLISKDGCNKTQLFTKSKTLVCNGYSRVVIGGRGPYVEFSEDQIAMPSFFVPKEQLYRFFDKRIYYMEFRSNDKSNVKLYYQLRTVSYANYKIGMLYISPNDLYIDTGECIIQKKQLINLRAEEFFIS